MLLNLRIAVDGLHWPVEQKHLRLSLGVALFFVMVMLFVHLLPINNCYGIQPRETDGLIGLLFSPFLHVDWLHLGSNLPPLFLLLAGLFYFYPNRFFEVLFLGILSTNFLVWIFARSGCIIGASGVVYNLAGFLVLKSFLNNDRRLGAFALIFIFLYGGLVWGVFPHNAPISWESHMLGALTGFIFALVFRKQQAWNSPTYISQPNEEDESQMSDNSWQSSTSTLFKTSEDIEDWLNYKEINYFYQENKNPESDS